MYTSNIVSNYLQCSGQLKDNIMKYQENAIVPLMEITHIHIVNN